MKKKKFEVKNKNLPEDCLHLFIRQSGLVHSVLKNISIVYCVNCGKILEIWDGEGQWKPKRNQKKENQR